ncbi:SulP family inorganic anion transporter [Bosea vaviloviae]|uniref:SulP family sulfate transporter n=1 Tax=Bosea vaviloviae TaxID=1526658 RepID=A0A1D7U4W9_9HYPH|nr:SulP family inorganic anion transporter [Bosea vaviloviae]AOO82417.1 SulP family sulfate transporter [Bosea vaviloviae]
MTEQTARGGNADILTQFTPKLVSALHEGYGFDRLKADALAGLTVAIVALPLSMAIAIASGATPAAGLFTAIVGGFFVSALGGSRYQIGGPAGAFIVLIAATIDQHGFDGLLLATLIAGALLIAIGLLRLGTYIRYIPHPVLVGFTTGIAIIIFASQIRDLLGLTLPGKEPAALLPKLEALIGALGTLNPAALALSLLTIGIILGLKRIRPRWPGLLIAVAATAALVFLLKLSVETIGTRFGGIPSALPAPHWPGFTRDKLIAILPAALSIAALGGIESLLSAVVADGMTGRRHRSNMELVAQGVANMASSLFGGICVTGTIARTATNVRAGGVTPVAGMLHALFILLFMLIAAPLATYIPLAALAGVLAVVSWNMAEKAAFAAILKHSRADAVVLLATFLLVMFEDLMVGIGVGVVLGSLIFMHRMAQVVTVEAGMEAASEEDEADTGVAGQHNGDVFHYKISGPLFFGASTQVITVLDRIGSYPERIVLDLSGVPFADSSAAVALKAVIDKAKHHGAIVEISGATLAVRRVLLHEGIREPLVAFRNA